MESITPTSCLRVRSFEKIKLVTAQLFVFWLGISSEKRTANPTDATASGWEHKKRGAGTKRQTHRTSFKLHHGRAVGTLLAFLPFTPHFWIECRLCRCAAPPPPPTTISRAVEPHQYLCLPCLEASSLSPHTRPYHNTTFNFTKRQRRLTHLVENLGLALGKRPSFELPRGALDDHSSDVVPLVRLQCRLRVVEHPQLHLCDECTAAV